MSAPDPSSVNVPPVEPAAPDAPGLPTSCECHGGGTDPDTPPVTVTDAVPFFPPLDAVTVNGPPFRPPAAKTPPAEIVPPPLTVHAKLGCGFIGALDASFAVAVKVCVAPADTVALAGATVMLVSTCGAACVVAFASLEYAELPAPFDARTR